MLKDTFYRVCRVTESNGQGARLGITLNPDHPVFQGHFPGNPVTPGVCLIQMLKEIVSDHLQQTVLLTEARQIKFLNILVPDRAVELDLEMTLEPSGSTGVTVKAEITHAKTTYFKFSGRFSLLSSQ
ncbi:hypothetical protein KKI24_30365 [bacterium]|nr:hypothetical protein [bacterium]